MGRQKNMAFNRNPNGLKHHRPEVPLDEIPTRSVWTRKAVFRSAGELEERIREYFAEITYIKAVDRFVPGFTKTGKATKKKLIDAEVGWKEPPTVSGLCLALGVHRQTLLNYEQRDRECAEIIRDALTVIQKYAEGATFSQGKNIGGIFSLKCNFGWRDGEGGSAGFGSMDANEKLAAIADELAIGTE